MPKKPLDWVFLSHFSDYNGAAGQVSLSAAKTNRNTVIVFNVLKPFGCCSCLEYKLAIVNHKSYWHKVWAAVAVDGAHVAQF